VDRRYEICGIRCGTQKRSKSRRSKMANNDILRLLKYIELFSELGILESEFKAFAEDDGITTIGELVNACSDEVYYLSASANEEAML
jgi:hypothetical protein